jgi:hypothetical protein
MYGGLWISYDRAIGDSEDERQARSRGMNRKNERNLLKHSSIGKDCLYSVRAWVSVDE